MSAAATPATASAAASTPSTVTTSPAPAEGSTTADKRSPTPNSDPVPKPLPNGTAASGSRSPTPTPLPLSLETACGQNLCPGWIGERLGLAPELVPRLEITGASRDLYDKLLEYFAFRAVDISEPVPDASKPLHSDPTTNARELPGLLSSLWHSPSSGYIEDDEKEEPPIPCFRLGLGYARTRLAGADIYIVHLSKGSPIEVGCEAATFRALHLFAQKPDTLKELCTTALAWAFERKKRNVEPVAGRYVLYTLVVGGGDVYWDEQGYRPARALSSVILPDGQLDAIVEDFRDFSAEDTKVWYVRHGLPYRRSYLFHGPPGVGKTSTIRALAGELQLSACFLSLGDRCIGNRELQEALRSIPKPSMLVIEDVDALFNEARKSDNPSPLTFSGLLNALDGLVSADGILTVMTTNHIERLDPALVRAGRVDRRFEFKTPNHEQIRGLFLSFYPDADKKLAKQFADRVFERKEKDARSIATLQEHFIFTRKKNAKESVGMLDKFFADFYPNGANDIGNTIYA